jgi:hypothetical protein
MHIKTKNCTAHLIKLLNEISGTPPRLPPRQNQINICLYYTKVLLKDCVIAYKKYIYVFAGFGTEFHVEPKDTDFIEPFAKS